MSWKYVLKKSYILKMKEFVKHIKSFFIDNAKPVIARAKTELKQVEKELKQIETHVRENDLVYFNTWRGNNFDEYSTIKDKEIQNVAKKLFAKQKRLKNNLQRYASIDEKLEIFNDPSKLIEYANNRYKIDLNDPATLRLFMETMRAEGMEPVEGAVKLSSGGGQRKDEKDINFNQLQEAVNMLASMNREAPSKQEVAEEMEIDINQQWDYRADEAYEKAIQLLRQRGKI